MVARFMTDGNVDVGQVGKDSPRQLKQPLSRNVLRIASNRRPTVYFTVCFDSSIGLHGGLGVCHVGADGRSGEHDGEGQARRGSSAVGLPATPVSEGSRTSDVGG